MGLGVVVLLAIGGAIGWILRGMRDEIRDDFREGKHGPS